MHLPEAIAMHSHPFHGLHTGEPSNCPSGWPFPHTLLRPKPALRKARMACAHDELPP